MSIATKEQEISFEYSLEPMDPDVIGRGHQQRFEEFLRECATDQVCESEPYEAHQVTRETCEGDFLSARARHFLELPNIIFETVTAGNIFVCKSVGSLSGLFDGKYNPSFATGPDSLDQRGLDSITYFELSITR
ncbi:hypothetical protein [Aliiroseovarius subalbicans]|uniref:hypothetical protein n=1 Tax=Aliiroseovarius subalbicans TaxID=2925840 RepID=UPI001F5A0BE4|nr:hypothetical protein [Aliiroseovarius subalbicans]MCI2399278.1 hypothetical protein [Aliiroseovarius subalbicans]